MIGDPVNEASRLTELAKRRPGRRARLRGGAASAPAPTSAALLGARRRRRAARPRRADARRRPLLRGVRGRIAAWLSLMAWDCGAPDCATATPARCARRRPSSRASASRRCGCRAARAGRSSSAAQLLVDATMTITVATGILNIWAHEPGDVATAHASIELRAQRPLPARARRQPRADGRPHPRARHLRQAADEDARATSTRSTPQPTPVPPPERVLAALGPKMLDLAARACGRRASLLRAGRPHARSRASGSGPGRCSPPSRAWCSTRTRPARGRRRASTSPRYLQLPNYTNNLLRHGFTDDDLRDGGSDRLVDAIVVAGGVDGDRRADRASTARPAPTTSASRCWAKQLLPRDQWRALAEGLSLTD